LIDYKEPENVFNIGNKLYFDDKKVKVKTGKIKKTIQSYLSDDLKHIVIINNGIHHYQLTENGEKAILY
jgi:hypothetical protein